MEPLLQNNEYDDGNSHGNQGDCHAHIANDLQREGHRVVEMERCRTQQNGKVCEVRAFAHCDGGIGQHFIPVAPTARPLSSAQGAFSTVWEERSGALFISDQSVWYSRHNTKKPSHYKELSSLKEPNVSCPIEYFQSSKVW